MAWTNPYTFVSGNILTAAQLNVIQDNLISGGPSYTSEAARGSAIVSPFEGQRAYIYNSTITAATGTTTAVPTGIQTIYNGSAWVTVTEVGAYSGTTGTTTSTSYVTTLTGDATAISVTLQTGTTALVTFSGYGSHGTIAAAFWQTFSVSGATTLAAADLNGIVGSSFAAAAPANMSRSAVITGLTAGTNTFTLNYKTSAGTATYTTRQLTVKGIA